MTTVPTSQEHYELLLKETAVSPLEVLEALALLGKDALLIAPNAEKPEEFGVYISVTRGGKRVWRRLRIAFRDLTIPISEQQGQAMLRECVVNTLLPEFVTFRDSHGSQELGRAVIEVCLTIREKSTEVFEGKRVSPRLPLLPIPRRNVSWCERFREWFLGAPPPIPEVRICTPQIGMRQNTLMNGDFYFETSQETWIENGKSERRRRQFSQLLDESLKYVYSGYLDMSLLRYTCWHDGVYCAFLRNLACWMA